MKYYSSNISERTSQLFAKNFKRMLSARILGKLCFVLTTFVDAIIGCCYVGADGIAAVTLMGPILALDEALHALLGTGTMVVYTRYCGKNEKENADRAYTSILIFAGIIYSVVVVLLLIFADSYVSFYANTPELFEMLHAYYVPLVIALPFFEMGLITEFAFSVDGRPFFFSLRGIVTIFVNTILDIIFVSVFSLGTRGLAYASIISTIVGYMITLSHIFSKKNTVHLDLGILKTLSEFKKYVKEELKVGIGYFLNSILAMTYLFVFDKFMMMFGGANAVFAFSVYANFESVVEKISFGFSNTLNLICGTIYGEGDNKGTGYIVKQAISLAVKIGGACTILAIIGVPVYLKICYVTDENTIALSLCAVRISCFAFIGVILAQIVKSMLLVYEKFYLHRVYCVLFYVIRLLIMASLVKLFEMNAVWIAYATTEYLTITIIVIFMKHKNVPLIPKDSVNIIKSLSARIDAKSLEELSLFVQESVLASGYERTFANKISLLVEEAYAYILRHNPTSRQINSDIRVVSEEKGIHISICDDGVLCNPVTYIAKDSELDDNNLEVLLLQGISSKYTYNRIAEINYTRIDCNF